MIFTRFRSSSWFYARIHLVSARDYFDNRIETWLCSIFFSIPRYQLFLSTLFPPLLRFTSLFSPFFSPFSPSQSFVLSTPTDIEFSSRRINFSFLLSAIPYWLMYPSVSSCSRFLFIVPRTPSIFRLAIGRFYFSLPVSAFHRTFPFYPRGIRRTRTR